MSDMPHVNEPDEQSDAQQPPLPKIETGPLSPAEMQIPEPPRYSAEPTTPEQNAGFDDWLASLAAAEEELSSFATPDEAPSTETGPMPTANQEAPPLGETGPQSVPASTQASQEPVIADPPEPEEALPDWLEEAEEEEATDSLPTGQALAESDELLAELAQQAAAQQAAAQQAAAQQAPPAEPADDLADEAEDNGIDPAILVATATAAAAAIQQAPRETPAKIDETAALAEADAQGEEPPWLQEVALGGEVPVTTAPVVEEAPEPVVPPAPVEEPVFAKASPAVEEVPATEPPAAPPPVKPAPVKPEPAAPQAAAAPEPVKSSQFEVGRCPRCGSTELGKGTMVSYGERFRPTYYKPSRLSFWRLHNFLRPFRRLVEVEGQVCRECGMMILQVDPDKLEKLEKKSGDRKK